MVASKPHLYLWLCFWMACALSPAFAQSPSEALPATSVAEAIDELLQFVTDEEGAHLVDQLLYFYDNPVDIAEASTSAISNLPTVSRLQASRLVHQRDQAEAPLSHEDVQAALHLSDAHYAAIRPFLHIAGRDAAPSHGKRPMFESWQVEWIQRYTRRLDLARGYMEEDGEWAYRGSPGRHYSRLRARHPNAQLNLTLDKAAGEALEWQPERSTYLFPHHAAYLQLNDVGPGASLILGDFSAGFGEGLTLSPMRMGAHGRDPFAPSSSNLSGIRPFGSSMRNQSFRGIATTLDVADNLQLTGFWSSTRRDATVDTAWVDTEFTLHTTGPSASGYYRTATERARRSRLPERTVGGAATYHVYQWQVGVVAYHTRYGAEITLSEAPHRSQQFQGSSARMIGMFGQGDTGLGNVFWEMAHAPSQSMGVTGGFHTDLSRFASILTSLRYLPANFDGLHGASFTAVGGVPQNEYGWYKGLRIQPHRHWTVDAYVDHQHFPWLRHYFALPSTGFDSRLTVQYEPYQWISSFAEFRYRSRGERLEQLDKAGRVVVGVTPRELHSLRAQIRYQFNPAIRMQLRADARRSQHSSREPAYGTLIYADLRLTPRSWLRLDQRITFFDADTFDARLFAYESDLLYSFNLPALHRTGQRAYLMATVQPVSWVYFQLKYAETRYENIESIRSGWDQVKGNRLREIRMQLRIRF